MAIRLHGSARTTPRIRAELQLATGSHRSLAKRYAKTMAKWRARTSVLNERMAPRYRASQHLSQEQEHFAIGLRKQRHLSLDDLMGQLLETAPRLSRSALHRCLQRHGICRQPAMQVPRRLGKFEETTLGFVHIDRAEMKIFSGKQHMFVAYIYFGIRGDTLIYWTGKGCLAIAVPLATSLVGAAVNRFAFHGQLSNDQIS
ncbi:hypothetical protein [Comamonas testosteroni]|nr:hypothetical protein [Comamonas testosteroni]